MKIAVLGWGSLIWCPGCLRIKTLWKRDGPELPIEFARISSGDRLTLVIHDSSRPRQTLWAVSELEQLNDTRENLKNREGCMSLNPVHAVERTGTLHGSIDDRVKLSIQAWLDTHGDIDAVVWTGLKSNWKEKRSCDFCTDDAIQYLKCLQAAGQSRSAEEYIRNAPPQVRTEVRARVETELGWNPAELPKVIFEEPQ